MKKSGSIKVGIVGLGNIAQAYDTPSGDAITTHVKACIAEPLIDIAWVSDINKKKAEDVCRTWNIDAQILDAESAARKSADIVCIASPDNTHTDWVKIFLNAHPKIIFCEKPLAANASEHRMLIELAAERKKTLVINYMRRWLPGVRAWLKAAAAGDIGGAQEGTVNYCRGLRHNACHGFDLIGSAMGSAIKTVTHTGSPFDDFSANDLTTSGEMILEVRGRSVPVRFKGFDGRERFVFDINVKFENGRLKISTEDGCLVCSMSGPGEAYHMFRDDPPQHMSFVWANLAAHLVNAEPLASQAVESLAGAVLVDAAAAAQGQAVGTSNE